MHRETARRHSWLITALATVLAVAFTAVVADDARNAPPPATGSATDDDVDAGPYAVVHRDGDLVVIDAKGTASSAQAADGDGYALYAEARLLDRYTVRLVDSSDIQTVRPYVEESLAELVDVTGQTVDILDGYAEDRGPNSGEIDVVVSADSPCGGSWLGYATPVVRGNHLFSARIWLHPRLLSKPAGVIDNTVRHELGHALGLGHFDGRHAGELQVMHATSFEAGRYRAGDIAGFRALLALDGESEADAPAGGAVASSPAPASSPSPTTTTTTTAPTNTTMAPDPAVPATVDPSGSIDMARATDVGIVVRGSARDPESSTPIDVVISMDGNRFEMAAGRQDQAGSHGFEVVWPAAPGEHEVCVLARNVGAGQDVDLGCRQVTVSSANLSRVGIRSL